MIAERLEVRIEGVCLRIAALSKAGEGTPLVFFHGFGSTKEDFADLALYSEFRTRPALAFDVPGCGESEVPPMQLTAPVIAAAAADLLRCVGISDCHLIGHSMGGLAALLFASSNPSAVKSFINIEGNLAPEDCFLSRQALEFPAENGKALLSRMEERLRRDPRCSFPLFAAGLAAKVSSEVAVPVLRSLVRCSDEENLLQQFISLPCPKMFMYGEENRSLPYLRSLARAGVCLSEVPDCGHFPMLANPPYMWRQIAFFLDKIDGMP